ncbi:MAG: glycosyltransferase family 4 protein [Erysipelotrichales bacterium]|nr:glycosyltransferase family 4 protein [Erysipelotrichales bacterium]
MKILIVSQYYYPEPFSVASVAENLVKAGNEVTVLTGLPNYGYYRIMPGYENVKFEIINGVNVHRVKVIPRKGTRLSIIKNYLSFWRNAKKYVKKLDKDFDIVYSVSLSPVISIAPAIKYAKKHKVKHVLHCLDLWPESVIVTGMVKPNGLIYKILLKWSRKLYKNTDKILVSSPSFIDYFKDVIGYNVENCKYVPQLSNEYKIPSHDEVVEYDKTYLNIVYCGNIGRIQLIKELIEAVDLARQTIKIRIYVIGLGSLKDYLLSEIKNLGLDENIIYLGAIQSGTAIKYFQNADALYLGLKDSGIVGKTIPNKLTFYMSQKRPIIAAISGDGREVLKNAKGSIISDCDANSLKDAFIKFDSLTKKEKEELALNNYRFYKENFGAKIIMSKIEHELKQLAK